MNQELSEWLLLILRWVHITAAIAWVGASFFFMWLDRSFVPNPTSGRAGHIGELWMVHGGGFYHVEKLQMGPTKVPEHLHWFKWESYWTWLSGLLLVVMVFYVGNGIFLLDSAVSGLSYGQGVALGIFSILGSWFVYDFLWESALTRKRPLVGHVLTLAWLAGMTYVLCHNLSGRAAYLHVGAMMGTWMTANVFVRIIPRQVKMVEAAKKGESLNPDWPKNAKNRSTHNTYFTLPVIFVMMSNHFPMTYGHDHGWIILLMMCVAGAAIREYFVARINKPGRAKAFGAFGLAMVLLTVIVTRLTGGASAPVANAAPSSSSPSAPGSHATPASGLTLRGIVRVEGELPPAEKLYLPPDCAKQLPRDPVKDVVIAHDGLLQNVLARIVSGHEDLPKGDVSTTPVEIDQRGCIYQPRTVAARVGQEVVFINSDPLFHNVRSVGKTNPTFNDSMPQQGQRISKHFEYEELMIQTKCSVHPWMLANLAIIAHPFFDVSDAAGAFEIGGLSPGPYELELWHEYYGTQKIKVTVAPGEAPVTVTFRK